MKKYKFKTWAGETSELFACPFCGGEPELGHKGNELTKKRIIQIKCKKCRCVRIDAAIYYGFGFLEETAVKNWNQRPTDEKEKKEA